MCTHIYVYMYICIYVCIHIYNIHRYIYIYILLFQGGEGGHQGGGERSTHLYIVCVDMESRLCDLVVVLVVVKET
jgi:hypothetical protein